MTIASDIRRPANFRSFWLGMAAYLIPTFPIAFVWHLVLFESNYHALEIYRADPIIPFGLASMIIQAIVFSWVFPQVFPDSRGSVLKNGLLFRARCRPVVMVVYNAGGCGKTSNDLDFGLCASRNRLCHLAVPDRGTLDGPCPPKLTRRTDEAVFQR